MAEFDHWMAVLELSIIRGVPVSDDEVKTRAASTPMALKLELDTRFGAILDNLNAFLPAADSPTQLLDMICSSFVSLSSPTSNLTTKLSRLLDLTARPMWTMLGHWLERGMPLPSGLTERGGDIRSSLDDERPLDREFLIQRDRDVSWTDEDFWESGHVSAMHGWPSFLGDNTEEMVMEAGKARGLVRAFEDGKASTSSWKSLEQILHSEDGSFHAADVPQMIDDYLTPRCELLTIQLQTLLLEEYGLMEHLDAIEGLMFMRGHSVFNEWSSDLFRKVSVRLQSISKFR